MGPGGLSLQLGGDSMQAVFLIKFLIFEKGGGGESRREAPIQKGR